MLEELEIGKKITALWINNYSDFKKANHWRINAW